jgi:hypothetical protein
MASGYVNGNSNHANGARVTPRITRCIVIDLVAYLDPHGFITNEGEQRAWALMARAPEGADVRICVGDLLGLVSARLVHCLIEGGIRHAREVAVEGQRAGAEELREALARACELEPVA